MKDENRAMAKGKDLPLSIKKSVEVCNFIRYKNLKKSRELLEKVIEKKVAVPFRRYNTDTGHKHPKVGPGRYPEKICKHLIKILDSVEANAQNKGLDVSKLYIKKIIPNRASMPWHYGRRRRIKMKRTHIDIVVEEREDKKSRKQASKETKK